MFKVISSLIVLLMATNVFAQQQILHLPDTTRGGFGGLNTIDGDFQIKPNEARVAHNIDWSRNKGAISKRQGWDTVGTVSGSDSLVGIFGAYYSTGEQQLFLVFVDSTTSSSLGHGSVWVTAKGSADVTSLTEIISEFAIQRKPSFTVFKDNVYIVNGQQKGFIFNSQTQIAHSWPPTAPGEPVILPLDSSDGELNGEYRYIFRFNRISIGGSSSRFGLVTSAVKVRTGRIRLTTFPFVPTDSAVNGGGEDSLRLAIYRTKANPGRIGPEDTAWQVTTDTLFRTSEASWNSFTFIDSISDANLSSSVKTPLIQSNLYDNARTYGQQPWANYRYGSPHHISSKKGGSGGILLGASANGAIPRDSTNGDYTNSVAGWVYACTFVDTIFNLESTLGPFLSISRVDGDDSITIGLPKIADGVTGMKINIYRAHQLALGWDTTWVNDSIWESNQMELTGEIWWRWRKRHVPTIRPDSIIIGDFFLLKQVPGTDTIYTDGTPYDSLYMLQPYVQTAPPGILDKIFTADNRIFGTRGNRLHFSLPDSGQAWEPYENVSVWSNDGDEIVTTFATRGLIRVLKTNSSYNVYQDNNLNWHRTEISSHTGSVAPFANVSTQFGNYYFTKLGIVRETEGQFLNRTQSITLISGKIKNLKDLPIDKKELVVGFAINNKVMFSVPYSSTVDTVFVYDELADMWSTWGEEMAFAGATMYGTESIVDFRPGDTMYFFSPGEKVVKRYPSGETNGGAVISMLWQSAPILINERNYNIEKIGVWGNGSGNDSIVVVLRDERGVGIAKILGNSSSIAFPLSERYRTKTLDPQKQLYYFIVAGSGSVFSNEASIDRFDIYYTDKGITEVK